jgi:hypothetical protein
MKSIIEKLSDVISDEEWDLLYNEVRNKILNELLREKYVKMILDSEETKRIFKILNDSK